jgi:hypothetical protein
MDSFCDWSSRRICFMAGRIFIIILLLLFGVFSANAQNKYFVKKIDFELINAVIKDSRLSILLVSELSDAQVQELKQQIAIGVFIQHTTNEFGISRSDTIKLTRVEQQEMDVAIKNFQNFKWRYDDYHQINLDKLSVIDNDSIMKNGLYDQIKYRIIPPLFFRNNEYCIFSYSYNCGTLCGQGLIAIFKRIDNGWQRFMTVVEWNE